MAAPLSELVELGMRNGTGTRRIGHRIDSDWAERKVTKNVKIKKNKKTSIN
jgi:hypothetical protein